MNEITMNNGVKLYIVIDKVRDGLQVEARLDPNEMDHVVLLYIEQSGKTWIPRIGHTALRKLYGFKDEEEEQ